jgi:WD40 repeat protein
VLKFGIPLRECIAHLYTCAVPFTPAKCLIRVMFVHVLQHAPKAVSRNAQQWPAQTHLLKEKSAVKSLALSPDGKQIASGCENTTICVWDAISGVMIGEPLRGHYDSVNSVTFSPDGKQIVSGSHDMTICIWDATSGVLIGTERP